jgi:hypothetical protein
MSGYPAIFTPPWDSPANALACLNALRPVDPWNPNLSLVPRYQSTVFPASTVTSVTIPKTSNTPYAYWLFSADNVVLVVGGTDGTHVPGLLLAWLNRSVASSPIGALQPFVTSCNELLQAPSPTFIGPGLKWWLIGHSFGGAICQVMANLVAQTMSPQSVIGWTFGSPRPGTDQFQLLSRGVLLYRYFNAEDVVALVPPHTNEGPILHFPLPDQSALFVNRQVQLPNGRSIAVDGTITNTESSSVPLPIVEPSLAAWISGSNFWQAQSHNPTEYIRRLLLSPAPASPSMGPNRTPPAMLEQPEDITVRALHQMVDAAIAALPSQTVPQQLPIILASPPGSRYTIRHRRGGWGVWFMGSMVALSRTKRAARKIARAGNRLLSINAQLASPPV